MSIYFVHGRGFCRVQAPPGSKQQYRLKWAQSIYWRKQLKWFTKVVLLLLLSPSWFVSLLLCLTTDRRLNIYLDFPLLGLVCSSLEVKLPLCLIVSHSSFHNIASSVVLVGGCFALHMVCNWLHFLKCYFLWSKDHAQILLRGKVVYPWGRGSGPTRLRRQDASKKLLIGEQKQTKQRPHSVQPASGQASLSSPWQSCQLFSWESRYWLSQYLKITRGR